MERTQQQGAKLARYSQVTYLRQEEVSIGTGRAGDSFKEEWVQGFWFQANSLLEGRRCRHCHHPQSHNTRCLSCPAPGWGGGGQCLTHPRYFLPKAPALSLVPFSAAHPVSAQCFGKQWFLGGEQNCRGPCAWPAAPGCFQRSQPQGKGDSLLLQPCEPASQCFKGTFSCGLLSQKKNGCEGQAKVDRDLAAKFGDINIEPERRPHKDLPSEVQHASQARAVGARSALGGVLPGAPTGRSTPAGSPQVLSPIRPHSHSQTSAVVLPKPQVALKRVRRQGSEATGRSYRPS